LNIHQLYHSHSLPTAMFLWHWQLPHNWIIGTIL
jgi:hypothetical protein